MDGGTGGSSAGARTEASTGAVAATGASPAMSATSTISSTASSVVNTLWTGASAVSNYVWSWWGGAGAANAGADVGREGASGGNRPAAPISAPNATALAAAASIGDKSPAPKPAFSYMDEADYGIRMVGRQVTNADEALLTLEMLSKIHAGLPPRFRLCSEWTLLYGSVEHGFSLSTLFSQARQHVGPVLTVVQDEGGVLFGVFGTEAWKPHLGHYGTGECFLWQREPSSGRLRRWPSTGKNSYYLISEAGYIAAGCGESRFGFWLDGELLNGLSQPVPTFGNPTLASSERFKCVAIEIWGLDMSELQ